MKNMAIFILILVLIIGIAFADTDSFAEAKKIIDAKTPCSKLSESELESLGDYFMEQMHPGQAHETMDRMMGGEGSESLKLMHISIAKRFYCGEINSSIKNENENIGYDDVAYLGYGGMIHGAGFGHGMMRGYENYYGNNYWNILPVLCVILLVGLIFLVYLYAWKLLTQKKK